MFCNSKWQSRAEKLKIYNPATGEEVIEIDHGTANDIKQAIEAADNAFQTWSKTSALERANFLTEVYRKMEERKENLAQVITKEMGKPIKDARGEVDRKSVE